MASNDKQIPLEALDEARLRELAACWRFAIEDGRLRGPGIAKLLARKRSHSVAHVVEALSDDEATAAVARLEVPLRGGTTHGRCSRCI